MSFPNGMAVTPDNKTLIAAETYGHRLTAFDIAPDGSLGARRTWADLPGAFPDGICLDAEGGVWYATSLAGTASGSPKAARCCKPSTWTEACFACALGGPDRRTLFIMAAEYPPAAPDKRTGQISGAVS
jgi:sugar lactone lactonase YvrE